MNIVLLNLIISLVADTYSNVREIQGPLTVKLRAQKVLEVSLFVPNNIFSTHFTSMHSQWLEFKTAAEKHAIHNNARFLHSLRWGHHDYDVTHVISTSEKIHLTWKRLKGKGFGANFNATSSNETTKMTRADLKKLVREAVSEAVRSSDTHAEASTETDNQLSSAGSWIFAPPSNPRNRDDSEISITV